MHVCPTSGDCLSCLIWRVGHTVVESLHDVGLHMKPRNGFTKPLDLALVALLQPPVSNKIPGCFSKLPRTPKLPQISCDFFKTCHCAQNVQRETKHSFMFFSHFVTPFSDFVRAFFTLVCRKETKHVKTMTDFSNVELRHFS